MNKRLFLILLPLLTLVSCSNNDNSYTVLSESESQAVSSSNSDNSYTVLSEPETQKVSYAEFYKTLSNDKYSQREYMDYGYAFPEIINKVSTFKKIIKNYKTFAIDHHTLGTSTSFDGVYHETGTTTTVFDFVSHNQETDTFKLLQTSDGIFQYTDKSTGVITLYDSDYFEKTFKPKMIKKAATQCSAFKSGWEEGKFGLIHDLEGIFDYYMPEGSKQDDYFDFYMNSQKSFFKVSLREKFHYNKRYTDNSGATSTRRVVMDQFDHSFYCGIVFRSKVRFYRNHLLGAETDSCYTIIDETNTIYY